jgi:hypothetical protein
MEGKPEDPHQGFTEEDKRRDKHGGKCNQIFTFSILAFCLQSTG